MDPSTPHNTEFDIILAGGGTAAGVIAGRLASACPSLRILLLEMGPHTQENPAHIQPARFLTHLFPGTKTARPMVARPSKDLDGRQLVTHCGQCLGGGSSINFAMYTRPPGSDYNDWANKFNNPGWSFDELLPLITKIENYQLSPGIKKPTHGYSGPLKVSYGGYSTSIGEDYLATVAKYDKARVVMNDANTMIDDNNHFERWPKWIDPATGRRSDVPHHYLYNNASYGKNLQVEVGCIVKRVLIEGGRAVGVEYVQNPDVHANADATIRTAKAAKMVVVSAGAFGSPVILERSGIGAPDVLKRNNVPVKVALPGVGENYNDHPLFFIPFLAPSDTVTLDGIVMSDPEELKKWSTQWVEKAMGLMSSNAVDGGCKLRPTPSELKAIGPAFSDRWESFYAHSDKPMLWSGEIGAYVGPSPPPPGVRCFCFGTFGLYPSSVGSVHIASGDDVNAPPEYESGALNTKEDVAMLRWGFKYARELGRRMSSYRGEYLPDQPVFPEGSAAGGPEARRSTPAPIDAPDIVYTEEDDKAIDEYIRSHLMYAWHANGTCAMKPREQGGVVDSRLNVYGVRGLKVADISICPSNVGTNTYSTALTIGEKAAALIAEELGIASV
ncbi:alcohol oxidase-like protein [Trametes gibbosa]|nr:alcohol oxidase-like protein [Trametes gibbosa]